jgi:hypothetical protein
MTVNAFKTRHLFKHKFRSQAEDAPPAAATPEEPVPDPVRT